MIDYQKEFSTFFDMAANEARTTALKYFRQKIPVINKTNQSPVTQADFEIEEKLRHLISKEFPEHGIIGEEYAPINEKADFVWVIDPIDGTKSFITGRPLFGTIIGLMYQGKPIVGLIDQAFTKERWFGVADQFCQFNGKVVNVAHSCNLDNARLYTSSIDIFNNESFKNFFTLCRSVKLTQYNCDCYAYGLLAIGEIDLVVERGLSLYDVGGIVPIISGAGGYISNWKGEPIDINFDGTIIAANSKELATRALDLLNG